MKIAVNTRWLLKDGLEGMGWYTHSLLKRLVEKHPEVEFHFIFDRKPDSSFKYGDNVKFHRVFPPARHPKLWSIWNHTSVPRKLRRIQPDIYFSPDGMAAKGWSGKQLLAVHDLNFEHYPEWTPKPVAEWYQKYMVQYARMADRLVCVSRTTMEDVQRTWGVLASKMDIVYNAPQSDFAPTNATHHLEEVKGSYFVCLGAINPRKNLSTAVRAFSKYRLQGGTSELVLVGKHMHNDHELDRVLEESPYSDKIHFVGRRQGEELNAILSHASALLFTSLFEGFGIPIIEAMAAGAPVISSNTSCMPEIVGKGGILLDPNETDLWTDEMHKIEIPENREAWIQKGLERAKFFSWDKSAKVLWKNIEQTIHGT